MNGVDYIKIDAIEVSDVYRLAQISGGSDFNELVRCKLHGGSHVGNSGVMLFSVDGKANTHNWIHHCEIYDAGFINIDCDDSSNLMKIGGYGTDYVSGHNTIEDNLLYWGGHHVLETYTKENVIRNNIFHNEGWMSPPAGISCTPREPSASGKWGNRNIQIYDGNYQSAMHNLIEGNRLGHAGPPSDGNGANNLVLTSPANIARYNTIFNAGEKNIMLKQGGQGSSDSDNNRIYNNTCHTTTGQRPGADSMWFHDASDGNVVINNIFYGAYRYDMSPAVKVEGNTERNNWLTTDGDPLFTNPDMTDAGSAVLPDLTLQAGSDAINQGVHLTEANGSGMNLTTLIVDDALFFQDGSWGSALSHVAGDVLAVGSVSNTAKIRSIDYTNNVITLMAPITWSDNDRIWLFSDSDGTRVLRGAAPDQGAHESSHSPTPSRPTAPPGLWIVPTT